MNVFIVVVKSGDGFIVCRILLWFVVGVNIVFGFLILMGLVMVVGLNGVVFNICIDGRVCCML